ncbi:unnamed protein product [Penicillium salamii]|uniref:Uncharacterized protein n=1 Tax=Penicillium salamii TaxID=1612424 RepID=A0A9W4JNK9_9EURO|nr:unnamed protein product [Penicillium salamii]
MATAAVHPPSQDSLITEKPEIPTVYIPHNVQTTLTFNAPREDGTPHPAITIGQPESYTRPMVDLSATIYDITGHELDYNLDDHGFQYHYHESEEKDFISENTIKSEYYPEVEQLLKDVTGASRVFIFDHVLRRAAKDWTTGEQPRGPIHTVHIDASYNGAESRVRHYLPDEAEELLKCRVQMISLWRPIRTVLKDPLAVSDAKTTPESGLEEIKFIFPDHVGGSWSVKPDPNIKWYYRYKQPPNLVTFLKLYDSKMDGRAKRLPHSAFSDATTENEPARESIEVRALLFHPDDTRD